jgi:anti-sigma factor (TIGR02949 family)
MNGREVVRCAGISRFVDIYLDGEFGEADRSEFERHLSECPSCRHNVRVQAEWQHAIRRAAPHECAPTALRDEVARAIWRQTGLRRWKQWGAHAMPAAAAIGILLSLAVSKLHWSPVPADVIAKHQRDLPIEISGGTDQVKRWYAGKVDFPVRPPRSAAGRF